MRKRNIWKRIVIAVVMLSLVLSNPSPALFMGTVYAVQEMPETDILENSDNTGAPADVNSNTLDTTPSAVEEGMLDTAPSAAEEDTLDTTTSTDETNTNDAAAEDGLISDVTGNDNGAEDEEDPEELPKEEQPSQPEGSMESRDELANASMDQAAAGMWPAKLSMAAPFSLENDPELVADETESQWKFNIYYVNEDDLRNVTKTEDFSLKYQMEFRALGDIEKGTVQITIPRALLNNRKGEPVNPSDIGVPMVEASNLAEALERGKETRNSSFNYFIQGDDLVFFNYKDIAQGTNAAWQVLYRNVKLMDIKDMTDWTLQAGIQVNGVTAQPEAQPAPLKGTVDSYFELTKVVKKPYEDGGLSHTPELYTQGQVKKYVDLKNGNLPTEYMEDGEEFEDFVYAVWQIDISGEGNQPVDLYLTEDPRAGYENDIAILNGTPGRLVGFKDRNNTGIRMEKDETAKNKYKVVMPEDQASWDVSLYAVTAYKKEWSLDLNDPYTRLGNNITVEAVGRDHNEDPEDPLRESQTKKSSASFKYENYSWEYHGNVLHIDKDQPQTWSAWLKLYETSKDGYGKLSYQTQSSFRGFGLTHPGIYADPEYDYWSPDYMGGRYELITVDDLLYASMESPESLKDTNGDEISGRILLGEDDYYYSSVTITQKDIGYDVWGDREDKPHNEGEGIDRKLYIYAMFEGENEWEPVADKTWDSSGTTTYTFTPEQIARHPYRVAVKHAATDYRTECEIKKEVFIKENSKIKGIINAYNDKEKNPGEAELKIKLEELSGIWGIFYDTDEKKTVLCYGKDTGEDDAYEVKKTDEALDYDSVPGLENDTKEIYGNNKPLPYRNIQGKTLTGLVGQAEAFKNSSSTNDPETQRILVDYSLTAYDGYQVFNKEVVDELKSTEDGRKLSPGRDQVVFYDLLPYGMQFDRSYQVTAGRITNLANENYKTTPALWNTSQVSLTADDIKITRNWRGTGRIMLEFHLSYDGADAAEYSMTRSGGLWAEGWGVSFRAYYDWSSQDVVQTEANVCAFMPEAPEETDPAKLSEEALRPLCGGAENLACDNGALPSSIADQMDHYGPLLTTDPANPDGGIDGNPYNKNIANVLFAKNTADSDGYAGANETKISKRIYAQEDQSTGEESATVVPGENYRYEIAVDVSAGTMEDLVIFDRLENAAADLAGGGYSFSDKRWHGTFQSVITTGMEKIGVRPEVYYHIGSPGADEMTILKGLYETADGETGAVRTYLAEKSQAFSAQPMGEGWVLKDTYEAMEGHDLSKVKAVAVALQAGENGSYVLGTEENAKSVSFQIEMKAPTVEELREQLGQPTEELDVKEYYAYNNPYYFALYRPVDAAATGAQKMAAVSGKPVKANLAPCQSLEVIKSLGKSVPDSVRNTSFRFRLYWNDEDEKGNEVRRGAAGKEYKLYKKTIQANGDVLWTEQKSRLYETDRSGYFSLRADEKAVFDKNLPDAEHIRLEEQANLFWIPEIPDKPQAIKGQEDAYRFTVTNEFRTVLFVEKKLEGVPESAEKDVSTHEFEFQVQVKKKGSTKLETLASAPMYYMDRASEYGAVLGQGTLDSSGCFSMRADQVAAVFLDNDVTDYQLEEIGVVQSGELLTYEKDSERIAWICEEKDNVKTGSVQLGTNRTAVTNYYRYKDLYLTKTLENQPEKYKESFMFQVFEIKKSGVIKRLIGIDEEEVPVTGEYAWELLNKDGTPAKDKDGKPIGGKLDKDGRFTAYCGGRTVRIMGVPMAAGNEDTTYVIRETLGKDSKYEAVKDMAEFTLHSVNDRATGEITNRYLYYSLSVSKQVLPSVGENGEVLPGDPDRKFVMKAEIEGEPLANRSYTLKDSDGKAIEPTKADYDAETEELKKDAELKNNRVIGNTRNIVLLDDGKTYAYYTNKAGEFWLKDGQTAVLEDVGEQNQSYSVYEKKDADFPQIISGGELDENGEYQVDEDGFGPATEGSFILGTKAGVTILNGGKGDYLILGKEYVGINAEGKAALETVPLAIDRQASDGDVYLGFTRNQDDTFQELDEEGNRLSQPDRNWGTWMSLEVTDKNGKTYPWHGEGITTSTTCAYIYDRYGIYFGEQGLQKLFLGDWENLSIENCPQEGYFKLPFGCMLLISKDALADVESYTLREWEKDQYKLGWVTDLTNAEEELDNNGYWKLNLENSETRWVEVKQRGSDVYSRSLAENSVAVIHNEVSGIPMEGSRIAKSMMAGSRTVPGGAKLVWKLEQYQGGQWVPAPGVQYISGQYHDPDSDGGSGDFWPDDYAYVAGGVKETDGDGRIVLEKAQEIFYNPGSGTIIYGSDFFPMIQFLEAEVYLNLYDGADPRIEGSMEGVYRLVEAPEDGEYDLAWGRLVGYSREGTEGLSYRPEDNAGEIVRVDRSVWDVDWGTYYERGFNVQWAKGLNYFCNASGSIYVDVEKQMEDSFGENFTMILKQAVFGDRNDPGIPGDNIPYRLYYANGTPVDEERHLTTEEGAFSLRPGQYARLELPHDTDWTVEEAAVSGYKKPVLNRVGGNLTLAEDGSRMYIHAESIPLEEIDWDASAWGILGGHDLYFTPEEIKNLTINDLQIGVRMSDGTFRLDEEEYELEVWRDGMSPEESGLSAYTWEEWKKEAASGIYSIAVRRKDNGEVFGPSPYYIYVYPDSGTGTVVRKLNANDLHTQVTFTNESGEEKNGRAINVIRNDWNYPLYIYVCLKWEEDGMTTVINGIESGTFSETGIFADPDVKDFFEHSNGEIRICLVPENNPTEGYYHLLNYIEKGAFDGCRSVKIYEEEGKGWIEDYKKRYKGYPWIGTDKVEFLSQYESLFEQCWWRLDNRVGG